MKRMKTSDNDLNFFAEYEADSVKLTSYFSFSFDKKFLKAFKKTIKRKVKSIHFIAPGKTRFKVERENELLKNRELAEKLKRGRKKFKKLIPSVYNKYLKLKPLDDGDYKTNKTKELELSVKDFLKRNYHMKKVVIFKELNDVIEIKSNLQLYDSKILEKINDIEAEVANLEEQLHTLKTDGEGEKFSYVNFLISLLKDSNFKIKVYNIEQNSAKFYALTFEFDAKRVYLNLFNVMSKGHEGFLNIEDLGEFDGSRFMSPSVKKGYLINIIDKLSKYNRKLVETREDERGFGETYGKDGYKVVSLVEYDSINKVWKKNDLLLNPDAPNEVRYMEMILADENGPKEGMSKYIADALMDEDSICPEPITVYVRNDLISKSGKFVKEKYGKDLGLRPVLAYYGDHKPQDDLPGYTKITKKFLDSMQPEMNDDSPNAFTHSSGKQFWTMPNGMGLVVDPADGSVKLSLGISYVYHSLTHIKEIGGRISSRSAVVTQSNWLAEMYRFMYKPKVEINKFELKQESVPIIKEIRETVESLALYFKEIGGSADSYYFREEFAKIARGEISPSLLIEQKPKYDKDLKVLVEELNLYITHMVYQKGNVIVPNRIVKIFNNDLSGKPLGTENLKKFVEYLDANYGLKRVTSITRFDQFKAVTDRASLDRGTGRIDYSEKLKLMAVELRKVFPHPAGYSDADFVFDTLGDYVTKALLVDGIKSDGTGKFLFKNMDRNRVAHITGYANYESISRTQIYRSFFTGNEVHFRFDIVDASKRNKVIYRIRNNADFLSTKELTFDTGAPKKENLMFLTNLNNLLIAKIESTDLSPKEKAYLTYLCESSRIELNLKPLSDYGQKYYTDTEINRLTTPLAVIAVHAIFSNLFEIQSGDRDSLPLVRLEISAKKGEPSTKVELSATKEELEDLVIPSTSPAKTTLKEFDCGFSTGEIINAINNFEDRAKLEFENVFKEGFAGKDYVEFKIDDVVDKFSDSLEEGDLYKIYLDPNTEEEKSTNEHNWYFFTLAFRTCSPISLKIGGGSKDFVRFTNKGVAVCDLENEDTRDAKIRIAELVSSFTSQLKARELILVSKP